MFRPRFLIQTALALAAGAGVLAVLWLSADQVNGLQERRQLYRDRAVAERHNAKFFGDQADLYERAARSGRGDSRAAAWFAQARRSRNQAAESARLAEEYDEAASRPWVSAIPNH